MSANDLIKKLLNELESHTVSAYCQACDEETYSLIEETKKFLGQKE